MIAQAWYGRSVAAVCALLAVLAASINILLGAEFGPREPSSRSTFAVTIRHCGVDAREMERTVAIPLEDALASAAFAVETSSASDYGKARVVVRFATGHDQDNSYEAVRDAAERVYRSLPASVQRPEIDSTSEGRGPVWVAAVHADGCAEADLGRVLERVVRPAFQKIQGTGDIELAGTGLPELLVEVDEASAAVMGIDAFSVARSLASGDIIVPAGSLRSSGIRSSIIMDGRYATPSGLSQAPVQSGSGNPVRLGMFATIKEQDRKPEVLSRVDGKPAITIAVNPGGSANLAVLSKALASECESLSSAYGLRFRILSDIGAEVSKSFVSTLSAAVQGAIAVGVASALLVGCGAGRCRSRNGMHSGGGRARLVAVAAVPLIMTVSAASLSALGFGLDRHVLAGLAVGLGASVDSAILAAERLARVESVSEGTQAMRELVPSLASGTATTLVVLLPLASLDFMSEGVARVAAAIAAVSVVSFVYTVIIMPPLILGVSATVTSMETRSEERPVRHSKYRARWLYRLLARNAAACARKPLLTLATAAGLSAIGLAAVLASPFDTETPFEENSVYIHLEFEPGAAAESVDAALTSYAEQLLGTTGVQSVQSTARRGSGSVLASFDPRSVSRSSVASAARGIAVPGGFAWLPGSTSEEHSWELVVAGDDDAECRRLATQAARAVASLPFVLETVLDFKDGPEDLVLRPVRERSAACAVGLSRSAASLRRAVHGPVAYKRLGPDGETDVRVTTARAGEPRIPDAASTLVRTDAGTVRIDSLMALTRERDASRITRRDRRRVASITMRARPIDPRKARDQVEALVAGMERPAGYSYEFDRAAVESARRLGNAGWSFLLAAALAYMASAAITESFGAPLAVLSALPPSLAVPALLLFISGTPMDAAVACAFVAVSGMAVNASVLTVDEWRAHGPGSAACARDLYRVTRSRIASLAATSGTSVAGSLPFLFLADSGGAMARSLAFVTATGTAASFLVAITVVPALAVSMPGLFRGFIIDSEPFKEGRPL